MLPPPATANDDGIRAALSVRLRAAHADQGSPLVIHEFGVLQGQARVDLAVVNGSLWGYEIKSQNDSLSRLPQQIDAYARVFDYLTVVTTDNHLRLADGMLPTWCGVWLAKPSASGIRFRKVRRAAPNPHVDPHALVQLLWRDEVLRILGEIGMDRGIRSKPRGVLWKTLVRALPQSVLALYITETLKARPNWREAGIDQAGHAATESSLSTNDK